MKTLNIRIFFLFMVLLTGLALHSPVVSAADEIIPLTTAPVVSDARSDSVLDVNDEIRLGVFGEETLSGSHKISNEGTILVPLIGEVRLAGLDIPRAEALITQKLSNGYLVDPSVSVTLIRRRPFYIMGEVHRPGSYEYTGDINALSAVAMAGGFTHRANRDIVKVLKPGKDEPPEYEEVPVETSIAPGDIIIIKERFF